MNVFLLISAVIILVCVLCNRISNRLGIPVLLVFILLGIFFGTDGIIKINFDNFALAEKICSCALMFIMFYGGFGTNWGEAKPVAAKAVLMSTAGVMLTAGLTGLFCRLVLKTDLLESFLIGAVISSTDAASVFSVLRSKRLNLKYRTASLLEIESGSNDPCSYMLTFIMLAAMNGEANGGHIVYMLFAQIAYGIAIGAALAYIAVFLLKKLNIFSGGLDTVFVFAMVIFSYAVPTAVGGNGYLGTYIFGIILGNSSIQNKKPLMNFFDGITGLMQILLFFLLGLLSFPSEMPKIMLPALLIALALTLVIRPVVTAMLLTPFKCPFNQQFIVSLAGLRGAASIVFAIQTVTNPAYVSNDIFHIVFFIVLFSILVQGTLLPYASKKLNMTDDSNNVLKTFNDYSDEVPVQFIQFSINENHPWAGKTVSEIPLPPETLLVQLRRGDDRITPDGSTVVEAGDMLILSARALGETEREELTELTLTDNNKWIGKQLSYINLGRGRLVIMIQRGEEIIIPNGSTVLENGDTLVINSH